MKYTNAVHRTTIGAMNKPLDLPDVTLQWDSHPELLITHKRTGMKALVSAAKLNAWLVRQLRQELVSPKEKA